MRDDVANRFDLLDFCTRKPDAKVCLNRKHNVDLPRRIPAIDIGLGCLASKNDVVAIESIAKYPGEPLIDFRLKHIPAPSGLCAIGAPRSRPETGTTSPPRHPLPVSQIPSCRKRRTRFRSSE